MDTSQTYIKMCDCEEIQEGKPKPTPGDLWAYTEAAAGCRWGITGPIVEYINFDREGESDFAFTDQVKRVWLPRQDQLQEMVSKSNPTELLFDLLTSMTEDGHICTHITGFTTTDYWMQFKSMEQLWLAFVMKEKYKKVWIGEKWQTITAP